MAPEKTDIDQPKKPFCLNLMIVVTRILVTIAIIGMIITSVLVIMSGFAEMIRIMQFIFDEGFLHSEMGKFLSVNVAEMIDLYLIGLVLIIISLGLYQLFFDPDIDLPGWLDTPSFDTLKGRLLIVVIVVFAVMFLGFVNTATDPIMIAGMGIAISAVMIACGYILSIAAKVGLEKKRIEMEEGKNI